MQEAIQWVKGPEWGIIVTVVCYVFALLLRNKIKWLPPLLTGSITIILLLIIGGFSYDDYREGGDYILFMLGPATIALGVPIYKYGRRMQKNVKAVLIGVTVGSSISILTGWYLSLYLGLSPQIIYSLLPRSVTTAVSVQVSSQLGGIPEATAVFTVLTGLLGSLIGPAFLRMVRIRNSIAIGTAIGTASHGIGTARLVADSEYQASISALSMSLSCIITPSLILLIQWWI